MTSIAEFKQEFIDIQRGIMRDYPDELAVCKMMHEEIGLGRTPLDDAEERAEALSEESGSPVDADSLDLTQEHAALHGMLEAIKIQSMMIGTSVDQVLATMFIIGRRYGMREAAGSLGTTEVDGLGLEEWLKSITDEPSDTVDPGQEWDER